jgi:hypothetical protein
VGRAVRAAPKEVRYIIGAINRTFGNQMADTYGNAAVDEYMRTARGKDFDYRVYKNRRNYYGTKTDMVGLGQWYGSTIDWLKRHHEVEEIVAISFDLKRFDLCQHKMLRLLRYIAMGHVLQLPKYMHVMIEQLLTTRGCRFPHGTFTLSHHTDEHSGWNTTGPGNTATAIMASGFSTARTLQREGIIVDPIELADDKKCPVASIHNGDDEGLMTSRKLAQPLLDGRMEDGARMGMDYTGEITHYYLLEFCSGRFDHYYDLALKRETWALVTKPGRVLLRFGWSKTYYSGVNRLYYLWNLLRGCAHVDIVPFMRAWRTTMLRLLEAEEAYRQQSPDEWEENVARFTHRNMPTWAQFEETPGDIYGNRYSAPTTDTEYDVLYMRYHMNRADIKAAVDSFKLCRSLNDILDGPAFKWIYDVIAVDEVKMNVANYRKHEDLHPPGEVEIPEVIDAAYASENIEFLDEQDFIDDIDVGLMSRNALGDYNAVCEHVRAQIMARERREGETEAVTIRRRKTRKGTCVMMQSKDL